MIIHVYIFTDVYYIYIYRHIYIHIYIYIDTQTYIYIYILHSYSRKWEPWSAVRHVEGIYIYTWYSDTTTCKFTKGKRVSINFEEYLSAKWSLETKLVVQFWGQIIGFFQTDPNVYVFISPSGTECMKKYMYKYIHI